MIKATTEELVINKLESSNAHSMARQGSNFFARINVPNLDFSIVRARDEDLVIKLETGNPVIVSLECLDSAPTVLPVGANLESFSVNALPRPELLVGLRRIVTEARALPAIIAENELPLPSAIG